MPEQFDTFEAFRENNVGFYIRLNADASYLETMLARQVPLEQIVPKFIQRMKDYKLDLGDGIREFILRQSMAHKLSVGVSDKQLRRFYETLAIVYDQAINFHPQYEPPQRVSLKV
jgi:hypothetical protein